MRILKIITYGLYLFIATSIKAQEINWANLKGSSKHIPGICSGMDYGSYYGLSYGYQIRQSGMPIIIGAEFNMPVGNTLFDDWTLRTGLQARIFCSRNWFGAIKTDFLNRKYNSVISEIYNIGADLEVASGFQKNKWGLAALINYDRSIASRINHKELKDYYPEISDGWYDTGSGNFKFGLRTNIVIMQTDFFLTLGKIYGQNFQDNPTLPFFIKMAMTKSF